MPRERSNLPFLRTGGDGANPYQYPVHNAQPSTSYPAPQWVIPTSPSVAMAHSNPSSGWNPFISPQPSPEEWPSRMDLGVQSSATSFQAAPGMSVPGQTLRSSCRFCRTRKIKCPGGTPCQTCVSRGIACIYDGKSKMGRPPLLRQNTKEKQTSGVAVPSGSLSSRQASQYSTSSHSVADATIPTYPSGPISPPISQTFGDTYFGSPPLPASTIQTLPSRRRAHTHVSSEMAPSPSLKASLHYLERTTALSDSHPSPSRAHHYPSVLSHTPLSASQQPFVSAPLPSVAQSLPSAQGRGEAPGFAPPQHPAPHQHQHQIPDLTIGTTASLFFFELFQSTEAWSVYAAAVQAWQRDRAHLMAPDHPAVLEQAEESTAEIYQGMMRWMMKDCIQGTIDLMSRLDLSRSLRYSARLAMDTTSSMDLDQEAIARSERTIYEISALSTAAKQNLFQTWMDTHPCATLLTGEQQHHLHRWENPAGWPAGWQALHLLVLGEALEWKSGASPQAASLVTRSEQYFWQLKMGVSQRDDAFLTLIAALFAWHHLCHFRAKKGSVYLALACHLPNSGTFSREESIEGRLTPEEAGKLALLQTVLNCQAIWTFMQLGTDDADLLRMMRFELERMWTDTRRSSSDSDHSQTSSNSDKSGGHAPSPAHSDCGPNQLRGVAREIRDMSQTVILTARLNEMYIRSQREWTTDRVSRDLEALLRSQLKLSIAKTLPTEAASPTGGRHVDEGLLLFDRCLHDTLSLAFRFLIPTSTVTITPEETVSILQDCLSLWAVVPRLGALANKQREKDTREQFHLNPPSPKTAMQAENADHNKVKHAEDLNILSTVTIVHLRISISALDRLTEQRDLLALASSSAPIVTSGHPASASSSNSGSPNVLRSPNSASIAPMLSDALACIRESIAVLRRASPNKLLLYQRKEVDALDRDFAKLQEKLAAFMPVGGFSPGGSLTNLWPSPRTVRSVTVSGTSSGAASASGSTSGRSPKGSAGAVGTDDRSSLLSLGGNKTAADTVPVSGQRTPPLSLSGMSAALHSWSSNHLDDFSFNSAGELSAGSVAPSQRGTTESGDGSVGTDEPAGGLVFSPLNSSGLPLPHSRDQQLLTTDSRSGGDAFLSVPAAISAERKTSIVWDSFWGSLDSLRSSWSAAGWGASGLPNQSAQQNRAPQQLLSQEQPQQPTGMISTLEGDDERAADTSNDSQAGSNTYPTFRTQMW